MPKKACLRVILALFTNKMATIHIFNVRLGNWGGGGGGVYQKAYGFGTKNSICNRGLKIFCKCQICCLTPTSRSYRDTMLKGPHISFVIGSMASKYENNL